MRNDKAINGCCTPQAGSLCYDKRRDAEWRSNQWLLQFAKLMEEVSIEVR
jgi:hypothetical protein